MVAIAQIILRAIQFVLTLLITALVGNTLDDQFAGSTASVNFAMFVAALCWVVVLYGLVAAFIESIAIPMILFALDGLATIFTFIAGIVLAARLGVHSCGNVVSEQDPSSRISDFIVNPMPGIPQQERHNKWKQLS